jgi:hypothetical protein
VEIVERNELRRVARAKHWIVERTLAFIRLAVLRR